MSAPPACPVWMHTPEGRLLIRAAAPDASPAAQHQGPPNVDTTLLWPMAQRAGLLPLLNVYAQREGGLPAAFAERLHRHAHQVALRNLERVQWAARVAASLQGAGVPGLVYKGPVVAKLAYGDYALREFSDVDVLVPSALFAQAEAAVAQLGFTRYGWGARPVAPRGFRADGDGFHHAYQHAATPTVLELHWQLARPSLAVNLPFEQAWAAHQTLDVGGHTVATFGPEHTLLVLCMHGGKHGWARLAWVRDVAGWLAAYPALDWELLWAQATQTRTRTLLALGLVLCEALGWAALPADDRARAHAQRHVARWVPRLLADALSTSLPGTPLAAYPYEMAIRDGLRAKLHFLAAELREATAPNNHELQRGHLPPALRPLYRVVRPTRLLYQYGVVALWRRATRSWRKPPAGS